MTGNTDSLNCLPPKKDFIGCRCMFCDKEGFANLDAVYLHQITVNSNGKSTCPKINRLDSNSWEHDILPMKINENKYAPRNGQGDFIYYNSDGKLINKSLIGMLINL